MTVENTRPNFFLLLGLHPDVPWDAAKFEHAIRSKRIEWSRQSSGVGRSAIAAKKNLELLTEIRRTMENPAEREKQAKAARTELASTSKTEIDRLEKELTFINAKGSIEQTEFDALVKAFKEHVPVEEITKRMTATVSNLSSTDMNISGDQVQPLEPALSKDIDDLLQSIHIADLYQLLALPPTTDSAKLCKAAESLYEDMVRRTPNAEITTKKSLAGHAKSIFKADETRKRYDESLRQRSLNAILKDLTEIINRAVNKEVNEKQVVVFLEATRKAGWSDTIALARLKDLARSRKWVLTIPSVDSAVKQLRCGYCHEMNDQGRKFCRQCNRELLTACPNCGHGVGSDEIGCGACGFAVGNRYYIDELLEKAAASQNLQEAQKLLDEAEAAWTPARPDARVQKIHERREQLRKQAQHQQQELDQLLQLIGQRQLFQAQRFIATHSNTLLDRQMHLERVDKEIARARTFVSKAQSSSALGLDEKADLYRQALRICADYQEARDLLKAIPPKPAQNLRVKVGDALVSLQWDPSPTPGVSYRIIRKNHFPPVSPNDGVLLATLADNSYDDTQLEIGIPLYYAVFTESEGVIAQQGIIVNDPVLVTQEVSDITAEVNNQEIKLKWQVPANVHGVIVVRKEGTPAISIHDGRRVSSTHTDYVVDLNVQNDHIYYYTIYCQFKNKQGGDLLYSQGKSIKATPEAPPTIVRRLHISHTKVGPDYKVQITWDPPAKGSVVLLKTTQNAAINAGTVLPEAQLSRHGQVLESQADTVQDTWSQQGSYYYIPIVLFAGMAYAGVTHPYSCIDEVSNLKCENLGTALRLQWVWPLTCQEIVLTYNYTGAQDRPAVTRNVTRVEYEHAGHIDIKGEVGRDYYIQVAAISRVENAQLTGRGVTVHGHLASKVIVSYEIKQGGFTRRRRMLHLYPRQKGTLPIIVIISRRDGLPLRKSDGDLIWRSDGPIHLEKEIVFPLPDRAFPPHTFGKLYLEDDKGYEMVNIHHPSDTKLRLG